MSEVIGDRFELVEPVGSGGFGTVYRALDRLDGRYVALKLVHGAGSAELGRFEREAALLAELRHPSVVRYIAHGRVDVGQAFLVMEWLEGQTLMSRLRSGWLHLRDLVSLGARVLAGLQAVSERGVIHRDIKPANLFLPAGRLHEAKVLDFGLARRMTEADSPLSRTGVLLGTPLYMSPEQARGTRTLDSRSDIFSLGSVLFEALCGVSPFEADTELATLSRICSEDPPEIDALRPEVPMKLQQVILSMLRKDARQRPGYRELALAFAELEASNVDDPTPPDVTPHVDTQPIGINGAFVEALRPHVQQRVLSAVLVGPSREVSEPSLQEILGDLRQRYGARSELLRNGSSILILERKGSPNEQAIAAAYCALALRERVPDCPIAVCMGKALLERAVPVGALLEDGALLLEQTPEAVIRVDEAIAGLLEARFELHGPDRRRMLERERTGGEAPRTLLGKVTPFVGRERELSQLNLVLQECHEEKAARAVLVTAPAGAGKSRLRFEFLQRLRREGDDSFVPLSGAGDALRGGAPFSALSAVLRDWAGISPSDSRERKRHKVAAALMDLVPESRVPTLVDFLAEMLGLNGGAEVGRELNVARKDPQMLADRVRTSWLEWLGAMCRERTLVIVIDDLHWADHASASFLEAGLRAFESQALMVLALARPEVRERFPKLWQERSLTELYLSKLGSRACEKLLDALSDADLGADRRRWLIERADGNPFFLEELVRSDACESRASALPDTVLGTIQARLDAMGEDAKLLLRVASVFGQEFHAEGLEALLWTEARRFDLAGWLRVLSERELLFERGSGSERLFVFRHALVRDAAYALLLEDERKLAHRLAAHWLASRGGTEPELLAQHWELGGDLIRAADAYTNAAMAAFEAHSLDDVIRLGERVQACGAQGARFFELCSMVAEAMSQRDRSEEAGSWASIAKRGLSPGASGWWRASQVLAIRNFRESEYGAAESIIEEMFANLGNESASTEKTAALAFVAINALVCSHPVVTRLLPAFESQDLSDCPPRIGYLRATLHAYLADRDGDHPSTARYAQEALGLARLAGDAHEQQMALITLVDVATKLGDYDASRRWANQGLEHPDCDPSKRKFFRHQLGYVGMQLGELQQAESMLRDACQAYRLAEMSDDRAWAQVDLARVHHANRNYEQARIACDEALASSALRRVTTAYGLAIRARAHLAAGAVEAALADARVLEAMVKDASFSEWAILFLLVRAECLHAAGLLSEAEPLLREAYAEITRRLAFIHDPRLRASFLTEVDMNARVLAWAHTWLGLASPGSQLARAVR